MGRYLGLVLAVSLPLCTFAQEFALPMDDFSRMQMLRQDWHRQASVHSGMQPVFTTFIQEFDHEAVLDRDTLGEHSWLHRKLFKEHFAVVNEPGLQFVVDPVFNFAAGSELQRLGFEGAGTGSPLYINTRGIAISAKLGEVAYVYTDFTENQARFPAYFEDFVRTYGVVPGSGRVKPFGESGFDYNIASAYLGFNVSKWLVLQGGHSKQFVGHGHRSLLLSDNAFNQPFASYTISLWGDRVQFRNNIALLQSLDRLPLGETPESLFKRKYMSYNYVSIKPVPSFEIGFYEAVQWQYFKEAEGALPFNWNALNPVIFSNTLQLGLDDADNNAMVGINAAWQFVDHLRLYGQYMRDRGGDAKGAYQVGVQAYGLFDMIDIQLEYNEVELGAYASANVLQGFHHYNQSLTHPFGSGFSEALAVLTFYHKRIFARAEWVYATFEQGAGVFQGENAALSMQSNLNYQDYQVAYIFNEKNQLQAFGGFTDRLSDLVGGDSQNQFWYLGLRTKLHRTYRNF